MKRALPIVVLVTAMSCANYVLAASTSECDSALIVSTYNKMEASKTDWRMASHVDQETYGKIKTSVGVSAVIYGVPVGANFDQFRENINNYKTETTQSYSDEQFRNIAWTGLGTEASDAYKECIRSKSKGVYLIPDKATDSDVSFRVSYSVIGGSPNPLPVTWGGGAAANSTLPATVSAGEQIIVLPRPKKSSTLVVNGGATTGFSDSVILTSLPPEIPEDEKFSNKCIIKETKNPGSVAATKAFSWTCDRIQAGTYEVSLSVVPSSARPVRLGWHADIIFKSDKGVVIEKQQLNASSGSVIDSSINAGIGTSFESYNNIIPVSQPGLLPSIVLTIDNTYWHHDFSHQSNDLINIPKFVNISVIRK